MWSPAADLCGRPLRGVRSRSPARQLSRAVCVAFECKVWKQVLIPTPDMPLFCVDFQAARHLISALDRLATLSGSTKTADGAGDGRRGVRTVFTARCRDGEQSGHGSCPWESALKWQRHAQRGLQRPAGLAWEQQETEGSQEPWQLLPCSRPPRVPLHAWCSSAWLWLGVV